ncbi:hypothetical protein [Mycolicibacterium sphagni]|uniref:hypothetical protein n=1 Tax=Mycolicibacterium sphagni TaxID=1786 RepID=UPI003B3AC672
MPTEPGSVIEEKSGGSGPEFRWCTVVHPNQFELRVHLTTPSKPLSGDCRTTCEQLKAKGVEFIQ